MVSPFSRRTDATSLGSASMMREDNARAEASVRVARGGVPARNTTTTNARQNTTVFRVPSEATRRQREERRCLPLDLLPRKPPGERVFAHRHLYTHYVSFLSSLNACSKREQCTTKSEERPQASTTPHCTDFAGFFWVSNRHFSPGAPDARISRVITRRDEGNF